jgi:hypothetical protein
MDKIKKVFYVFIIIFVIFLYCDNNQNKYVYEGFYNTTILEPNINGNKITNINVFNGKINDIDPSDYYENNGFLVPKNYDNLIIGNFDNNTKRSLALASLKEIFNDTKTILNGLNKHIEFNFFGVRELQPNYNDYKPILNIIFNSINANADGYFLIKPNKQNKFKLYKNEDKYLFNLDIECNITNTNDDFNKQNAKLSNEIDFDKLQYNDTLTTSNPLKINAIIQFIIEINNNYNIYINNLSVLSNID